MLKHYFCAPLLALLLLATGPRLAYAQTGGVGIGTTAPDASAALEVQSTSRGLLPPRLSKNQRDAILNPATGLTIYNTTSNKLNVWNGTSWTEALAAPAPADTPAGVTFAYSGAVQTYVVPAGVVSVQVTAVGGDGGGNPGVTYGSAGGRGARVQATLAVVPGQSLYVYVGGAGTYAYPASAPGGFNGGGASLANSGGSGGGASDIRTSAGQLSTRVLVAGGGGGKSSAFSDGGAGGTPNGGYASSSFPNYSFNAGGTQFQAGTPGNAGLGVGSTGGTYGGGGNDAGGAGGSSWVTPTGSLGVSMSGSSLTFSDPLNNGSVSITPTPFYAAPALNGANIVNVPGTYDNLGNHLATQNLNLASYQLVGNGGINGLSIDNGGNVGIGTTTPSQKLDVNGNANVSGNSYVAGNVGIGTTTPGQKLDVNGNANVKGNATVSGNVGIGTTTPSQKLDVAGNANVSGNSYVGGNSTVNGNSYVAGTVGIGTTAPNASAALDVSSTSKGLLPPRLSQPQRDAITNPATGLTIYNTDTNALNVWNGTSWGAALTSGTQPAAQSPPVTFGYTGGAQTYTVPAGIYALGVDARGAQGAGPAGNKSVGGPGGRVVTTLAVTPGETLTLYVGGVAGYYGGYNGGGRSGGNGGNGGGATDVRRSATVPSTSLADRLVVAGGGGGASNSVGSNGAGGGGLSGASNDDSGGGTQTAGGAGGTSVSLGTLGPGTLGQGGSTGSLYGGAGGGGYYGGGAGYYYGGSGGSGYAAAGSTSATIMTTSNTTMTTGTQAGNGSLTLTPMSYIYAAPAISGANIVNVPGTWSMNGTSYYYNNGNVGIGTNSPGQQLDVAGNANVSGNSYVGSNSYVAGSANVSGNGYVAGSVGIGTTTPLTRLSIQQVTAASNAPGQNLGEVSFVGVTGRPYPSASIQALTRDYDDTGHLLFKTSPGNTGATERLRITADGLVGIGTSSPGHQLTVTASSSGDLLGFNYPNGTDKYNWSLTNGGLNLNESNVAAGRFFVQDGGNVGIGTTTPSQKLDVAGSANVSGNSYVGGNLGIGTTTPVAGLHLDQPENTNTTALGVLLSGGTSGNASLELRGNGRTPYIDFAETQVDFTTRLISSGGTLNVNGSNTLLFKVNGNMQATNVSYTSDQRLKQEVRPLQGALASVLALRGVRYRWNPLGVQRGGTAGAEQVGVLAQEVEKIYPELVSTNADGYKAVNYAQLTPVLIEAIKEQQAQIEALKAEAATAKAQATQATATLETFEARLRRLEAAGGQAQR